MALIEGLLQELEQEAQTTRRVLERVPEHQLGWRPHEKARTLGELAMHVAIVPGGVAQLAASPSPAPVPQFADPSPTQRGGADPGARREHREGQADARRDGRRDDHGDVADGATATARYWRIPRIALLRSIMLNHWYHHRGQLTVYLRELDVPIPSIYGPSADENPFG